MDEPKNEQGSAQESAGEQVSSNPNEFATGSVSESELSDVQRQIDEMESQWAPRSFEVVSDLDDEVDFVTEETAVDHTTDCDTSQIDSLSDVEIDRHQSSEVSTSRSQPVVSGPIQPIDNDPSVSDPSVGSMVLSTLLSLIVILVLLLAVRFSLPPLIESVRFAWTRGQLRAEFEASGNQLRQVSLEGLSEVSQLVSKRVGPSLVHINVGNESKFMDSLRMEGVADPSILEHSSQGSGVIISSDGFILTNRHVLDGGSDLEIQLSDGRIFQGLLVGSDDRTDLAVIKIEASNLLAIAWGDSDAISVGSPVWALGSPFGLTNSITFGILSGKHRMNLRGTSYMDSSLKTQARYGDLMQSDVAVNPGNSGGPLVNAKGELIGVNAAILGESYRGVSFSIPSNVARRVYDSIVEFGEVERGWIGIRITEVVSDSASSNPQIRIEGFGDEGDSPAKNAGLKRGDILLLIAGVPVESLRDVAFIVEGLSPGSSQPIRVIRNNKTLDLMVTIGSAPKS